MTLLLRDLDIPVLVPTTTPLAGWEIADSLTNLSGSAGDQEHWSQVTVAERERGPGTSGWMVTSVARRGMRPLGPARQDGLSCGPTVDSLAISAVGRLLTRQASEDLSEDEDEEDPRLPSWRVTAEQVGDAFTLLPRPGSPWQRTTMIVDGQEFALWVHERAEGTAAVADLGPCVVSMHGMTPPPAWTFTLLSPADAVRVLAS